MAGGGSADRCSSPRRTGGTSQALRAPGCLSARRRSVRARSGEEFTEPESAGSSERLRCGQRGDVPPARRIGRGWLRTASAAGALVQLDAWAANSATPPSAWLASVTLGPSIRTSACPSGAGRRGSSGRSGLCVARQSTASRLARVARGGGASAMSRSARTASAALMAWVTATPAARGSDVWRASPTTHSSRSAGVGVNGGVPSVTQGGTSDGIGWR